LFFLTRYYSLTVFLLTRFYCTCSECIAWLLLIVKVTIKTYTRDGLIAPEYITLWIYIIIIIVDGNN
jgi:hypothetical protein